MKNPLANMMQQAQKMQEKLEEAQKELANLSVTGESGAGAVTIVMNGKHEAQKVTINAELVGDDTDMLEDLVAAAINDAVNKLAEASQGQFQNIASGVSLPPGFKLPF